MAFNRPTLADLIERVKGDLKSGLEIVNVLRRTFLEVIAKVLAGLAHLLFGYLQFIEKQAFPDTATDEYLERWAGIWGVYRKAATFAEFTLQLTGTPGTVIPIATVFRRADGFEYTTDAEITLSGVAANDRVGLTSSLSGSATEVQPGDSLSILSPIAGLDSNPVVYSVETEPEDTETDDSLRARLIARIQNPPSGGAATDYILWALSVAGVTRAWVGPEALGPGTVVVWFVSDDEDPITPSPAKIQEVADYIETVRPVTANVTVVAPVLLPLDMTIQLKPNNAATQQAVINELTDLIMREASLAGSYKSPGVLNDGKILFSRINEAISIAVGEEDHVVTLINGDPPDDITPADGQLIVLGDITWQTLA